MYKERRLNNCECFVNDDESEVDQIRMAGKL